MGFIAETEGRPADRPRWLRSQVGLGSTVVVLTLDGWDGAEGLECSLAGCSGLIQVKITCGGTGRSRTDSGVPAPLERRPVGSATLLPSTPRFDRPTRWCQAAPRAGGNRPRRSSLPVAVEDNPAVALPRASRPSSERRRPARCMWWAWSSPAAAGIRGRAPRLGRASPLPVEQVCRRPRRHRGAQR